MADNPSACFSAERLRFLAKAACMQPELLMDLRCSQVLFLPDGLLMDGVSALDVVSAAHETEAEHS